MSLETKKLAGLLRTSDKVVLDLERKMERITGKKGIIEKIIQENEKIINEKLDILFPGRDLLTADSKNDFVCVGNKACSVEEVYNALIDKAKESDDLLYDHFHKPDFSTTTGCSTLINVTKELTGDLEGYYLKEEKAKELLRLNPPRQIMASLGYGNDIDKLIDNEDIFEIFCALRFAEDSRWLNDIFFKPYIDLKKDDFEKRKIKIMVLPNRWLDIGKKFLGKKLHHMSHLKELGIVFVIPISEWNPGETLYAFFMTLHYTHEVDWHSRLFRMYSNDKDFANKIINALKVEVSNMSLPDSEKISWRIVPKYLAKKDPSDPRLAEPHISPEAWHYYRTSSDISKFIKRFPDSGLKFWEGLDVAGTHFPDKDTGKNILISFDLFDNGISLLQRIGFESKYLYHQQEALWNKVFIEYMGEEAIDNAMIENLDKGFITL